MGSQATWKVSGTLGVAPLYLQHVVDDKLDHANRDFIYQSILVPKPEVRLKQDNKFSVGKPKKCFF